MERRLAAILTADVVGYTRLIEADDAGTLLRFTELRQQALEPLITEHHGRIVKLMGDGFLVHFASVVDAVTCALAWQKAAGVREASEDEEKRLKFRIGINLGDVIFEDDDIHGDGVNIAARLEGQAEPGGICLSEDAYRQCKGKVSVEFEDLGDRILKNVTDPVRVYRVAGDRSRAGVLKVKASFALPDKPSIAVLPFINLSGTPEQEYFSDGVTEDIITELSRFRELFVIARFSSFSYKGKSVKIQDVALDLGVRYVLEGSIRLANNRVRITAQLVDAETGHDIWSERYNRDLTDLLALQEEISRTVAANAAGRLRKTAEDRAERKPMESLQAYDYALRGQSIVANTREDNRQARWAFEQSVKLDPTCTRAYVGLALSYVIDWFNQWSVAADRSLDHALKYAAKAVSLDNTDSKAQLILGHVYEERREYEQAIIHLNRAIELNPNDADAYAYMGAYLEMIGKPAEAIDLYQTAMRLNPYYPPWYLWKLGDVYYSTRRYKEAKQTLQEAIDRNPKMKRARMVLAATHAQLGEIEKAQSQMKELLLEHPELSLKQELEWGFANEEMLEHWLEGLRKAGLPE